jgi:cytochrome o ubiquinol oxidase operon protein cyoD
MPTFKTYLIGFITSIILTLAAYFAVVNHLLNGTALIAAIVVLALVQFIVQLIFFLHFGRGEDGSWNLVIFFSTVGIILILVVGSIWIMNHLNYNMTPQDINNYMSSQDGI